MYIFMKKRNKYLHLIWNVIACVVLIAFVGADLWIG